MAWLEREGFSPLSQWIGWDGYFAANIKRWPQPYGSVAKVLYRGGQDRRYLRAVADRLTEVGVPWTAEQNDYGYWMLIVPLCDALIEAVTAPRAPEPEPEPVVRLVPVITEEGEQPLDAS